MEHGKGHRKFGRVTKQRVAMMNGLVIALVEHEKIKTTQAKAKELRPYVEKIVTKAKKSTLQIRRLLISKYSKKAASKLIDDLGKRFADRPGGYTRIRLLSPRISDGAKMAYIEFLKS